MAPAKLSIIIQNICNEYNVPAYHNFSHGFSVFQVILFFLNINVQTLFYLLKKSGLSTVLAKHEIFAALIAALGHDLNHSKFLRYFERLYPSRGLQ